jgi:hypothetical protein
MAFIKLRRMHVLQSPDIRDYLVLLTYIPTELLSEGGSSLSTISLGQP